MTRTAKDRKDVPGHQPAGGIRIPERYQHLLSVLVIFLALVFFFRGVIFKDQTFLPPDTLASLSFQTLVSDAEEAGVFPLWNPYIFCGMPAYASATVHGERLFDLSAFVLGKVSSAFQMLLLDSDIGWVLFYYFLFGAGMYLLAWHLVRSKIAALVTALGAVFSTPLVIWVMIGHMTKMPVIAFFPYILLILERLRVRFSWTLAVLLALAIHFLFLPGHYQVIFYVYLAVGVYYLFNLLRVLVQKQDWKGYVRAGATFAAASVMAFLLTADGYLSTLEYVDYSMRGTGPIVATAPGGEGVSQSGGLDYTYATNWSLSPGEMMTFFVPSWYGFGWHTYQGLLSQNQPLRLNTYVGPQPFVDVPFYFGIVILALALLALIRFRKDPFVQYLAIVLVLALLVGFGREFPYLYDILFHHLPFFNKFRVPSLILTLVAFVLPLLAAYAIAPVVTARALPAGRDRRWRYGLLVLAAAAFLSLVGRGVIEAIHEMFLSREYVAQAFSRSYGSLQPAVFAELHAFLLTSVSTDVLAAAVLLLAVFGSIYACVRKKLPVAACAGVVLLAVVADLWRVGAKPMDPHPRSRKENMFRAPGHIDFLLQDTTAFRMLEFSNGQVPYDNSPAYWRIEMAHGYQGAKMRAYQDMVDVAGLSNPLVWKLMNVKYVVSNRADSNEALGMVYNDFERKVYVFPGMMPRAFFVNRYEVAGGLDILQRIAAQSFDPRDVAFFMEDPLLTLDPAPPVNTVEYLHRGIQDFTLRATAYGNNLLFLSETYYPEGWKAFLDGKEIPVYRLNYLFRGVVIPPGTHTLEMRFEPRGFAVGRLLSLGTNVLLIAALAGLILVSRSKGTLL